MKNNLIMQGLQVAGLLAISMQGANAACNVGAGGDANIAVSVEQPLSVGKITALDAGEVAAITIGANGVRSIPSTVFIGDKNTNDFGDSYAAARLNISGSPDCKFRLTIGSVPGIVSNVTLQGIGGTLLNSSSSGATGTFSSTGLAKVHLGATVTLNPAMTGQISESITVSVDAVVVQ